MRLYAIAAAAVAVVGIVILGKGHAFADTTSNVGATSPAQTYVTVQEGDDLSGIANSYSTTYVRVFDANEQISNPDLIYPGEVLRIPASSEQLPSRPIPGDSSDVTVVSSQTNLTPVTPDPDDQNNVSTEPTTSAPATNTAPTAPQVSTQAPDVSSGSVWDQLAQCESGGNWSINTGNGFYGGLQFTLSSWQTVGGIGYPNQASRNEQILRAEKLQAIQGWGAWPVCSAMLGL